MTPRRPWVVGVTGASGAPYARRLLRWFAASSLPWDLIVSESARVVLAREQDVKLSDSGWAETVRAWLDTDDLGDARWWPARDMAAGPSSGSYPARGMLIVPCSMNTVAAIAHGFTENLVQRAASVCLKERRPLVVCFREAPLNRIHLQNLLAAHDAGAAIVPAAPGFYTDAAEVSQLIDFVAGRVLDVAGIDNRLYRRWSG